MTKTTWAVRGWRLIWQLVWTLVEVAIALLVLTVGEGKFQQVTLGALVAIYANIRIIAFGLDVNFAEAERANQARLVLLAKVLQSGNEIVDEELRSAVQIYKEKAADDWISLVGFLVIVFAAVARIITAII